MSVYIDSSVDWGWRLGPSCHLIADTQEELDAFAIKLGMRTAWRQWHRGVAHYDLTQKRRAAAVRLGVTVLDRREFVGKMRELRPAKGGSGGTS